MFLFFWQIVKNLLYLAKVVKLIPRVEVVPSQPDDEQEELETSSSNGASKSLSNNDSTVNSCESVGTSLSWLIMRLGREVKTELNGNSKTTIKVC